MPAYTTVSDFLSRVRLSRLDEELDVDTNLWSDTDLLEYMNEGLRKIWLTLRETKENYFLRKVLSTDSIKTLGGRDYDPDDLTLRAGRDEMRLPPDLVELRSIEPIIPEGGDTNVITFEHRNISSPEFRTTSRLAASINSTTYLYDIEFRADGKFFVIVPRPGSDVEDVEVTLKYVYELDEMTIEDGFEGTGLTNIHLDALKTYVVKSALKKTKQGEPNPGAEKEWETQRVEVQRAAGPRQSREPELVQGYLEEELY